MRRTIVILLLACLLLPGVFSGVCAQEEQSGKNEDDNGYSQISLFAKAIQLIRQAYADGNKTSYHDLITAALKGMLSSLDPHSQFLDPYDFRDLQESTRRRSYALAIASARTHALLS